MEAGSKTLQRLLVSLCPSSASHSSLNDSLQNAALERRRLSAKSWVSSRGFARFMSVNMASRGGGGAEGQEAYRKRAHRMLISTNGYASIWSRTFVIVIVE